MGRRGRPKDAKKGRPKDEFHRNYEIEGDKIRLIYVAPNNTKNPFFFRAGVTLGRIKEIYQVILGEFPINAPAEENLWVRSYCQSVNCSEFYWVIPADQVKVSELEKRGFTPYVDWEAIMEEHEAIPN